MRAGGSASGGSGDNEGIVDAILLAAALGFDALLLLNVAWVQARQVDGRLLRVLDAHAPLAATALVVAAVTLLSVGGLCGAAVGLPRVRDPLWTSRALPLAANLI